MDYQKYKIDELIDTSSECDFSPDLSTTGHLNDLLELWRELNSTIEHRTYYKLLPAGSTLVFNDRLNGDSGIFDYCGYKFEGYTDHYDSLFKVKKQIIVNSQTFKLNTSYMDIMADFAYYQNEYYVNTPFFYKKDSNTDDFYNVGYRQRFLFKNDNGNAMNPALSFYQHITYYTPKMYWSYSNKNIGTSSGNACYYLNENKLYRIFIIPIPALNRFSVDPLYTPINPTSFYMFVYSTHEDYISDISDEQIEKIKEYFL